jgi:dihydroxy-acid dehydratase
MDGGLVTDEEVTGLEENACPTAGACPIMGTANTMQILAEVMGLALPGSSTIPAVLSDKTRAARLSGRAIVRLIKKGISIRDIVEQRAITKCGQSGSGHWWIDQRGASSLDLCPGAGTRALAGRL